MSPLNFVPFCINFGDMRSQNFPISEAYNEKPERDSWYRKSLSIIELYYIFVKLFFFNYGNIRRNSKKAERFGW